MQPLGNLSIWTSAPLHPQPAGNNHGRAKQPSLLRGADGGDRLAGVRRMSRLGSVSALECLNVRNENGSPVSSGTTSNTALGEIGHAVCGTALPIPGKVWDRSSYSRKSVGQIFLFPEKCGTDLPIPGKVWDRSSYSRKSVGQIVGTNRQISLLTRVIARAHKPAVGFGLSADSLDGGLKAG